MAIFSLSATAQTALPNIFKKVTSTDELTAGSQLLIVYESTDGADYALGAQLTNSSDVQTNRNASSVTISNEQIDLDAPQEETPTVLTLGVTDGGYTFYGDDGYYLVKSGTDSQNRLSQSSSVTDLAQWTISIADGVARIQNVGASDFYIQKNKTSKLFAAYKSTQYDVVLYKKDMSKPGIPTFSVESGTYYQPFTVAVSALNADEIRYTLNGVDPAQTDDYEVYDEDAPLYIDHSLTLKAVAVKGVEFSAVVTAEYKLLAKAPVLSLAGGTYLGGRSVSIACDEGNRILYTIDETDPTTSETAEEYDEDAPIYFEHSGVLKAVAVSPIGLTSEVVTAEYTIKNARNRFYNFNYTSEEDLAYYGITEDSLKNWNIENYENGFMPLDSLLHTEGLEFGNVKSENSYYRGDIWMYPNYAIMPRNTWIRITDVQPNDKITIYYGPAGGYSDDTRVGGYLFQGATLDDDSQKLIKGRAQWVDLTVNNGTDHVDFTEGYLFRSQSGYEYFNEAEYYSYIYYILVNPMIASIGDDLFASYVTTGETDFKASGIKAYTVTAIEDGYVSLTEIETAAKGTPVVVENEKAGNWILTPSDWGERITDNLLKASDGTVVADGTHYAFANKESGVGFYKVQEGLTIPEGSVYLTANAGGPEFLGFTEGTTTGITQMEQDEQPITGNGIYSLSGVRVQNPTEGLYITNGKKMFIK